MPVRVTTYAYPWDLVRLGVERTLKELAAEGIEAIDLAATYHPIDALSPRDGAVRLFSSARGAVHFPARTERYGRIKPSLSTPEVCAVWPEVADRAPALGLAVNSWTVMLYQPWIVDAHPDCARVLPGGDPIGSGVCPANDDVRDYVATLCDDIVDQFEVSMLHLEGLASVSYDYGWLRPRVLIDVPPLARELLAICFCASCARGGAAAGIDVERVRRLANDTIALELDDGLAVTSGDRAANLAGDSEFRAFVVQHERASIALARSIVSRIDASKVPRISSTVWSPYSTLLGDAQEELLEELISVVDQLLVFPKWGDERTRLLAAMATSARQPVELRTVFIPKENGSTAAIPADVFVKDAKQTAHELQAAAALGVSEVGVYNYGLLRERDVHDVVTAVRSAFS